MGIERVSHYAAGRLSYPRPRDHDGPLPARPRIRSFTGRADSGLTEHVRPGNLRSDLITREHRAYSYRPKERDWPIPLQEVISHSTNMHMIPATPEFDRQLKGISAGDIVDM